MLSTWFCNQKQSKRRCSLLMFLTSACFHWMPTEEVGRCSRVTGVWNWPQRQKTWGGSSRVIWDQILVVTPAGLELHVRTGWRGAGGQAAGFREPWFPGRDNGRRLQECSSCVWLCSTEEQGPRLLRLPHSDPVLSADAEFHSRSGSHSTEKLEHNTYIHVAKPHCTGLPFSQK